MHKKSIVVLSGGQDSTTCLYWALRRFDEVEAISFDYGQRHSIELECAKKIAGDARVSHTVLPISTFQALGNSALTDTSIKVGSEDRHDLPSTFVPGRNLAFLVFAAAYAWPRRIDNIVTGVAQTDYSGYPDCREPTIKALEEAINLGMESNITIHTPLMHCSKAETVRLAVEVGAIEAMRDTHTCYRGGVTGSDSVAVFAKGEHLCMTMRGVRTPAIMSSSSLGGRFKESDAARSEFFSLCRQE